jgi:hypothetical protein
MSYFLHSRPLPTCGYGEKQHTFISVNRKSPTNFVICHHLIVHTADDDHSMQLSIIAELFALCLPTS